MKTKQALLLGFLIISCCNFINCHTSGYNKKKYPIQTDTPISLLKQIDSNSVKIIISHDENLTISAEHKTLKKFYFKLLKANLNEEFKEKVIYEFVKFNRLCDSAMKNNSKLSLVDEPTALPILKSQQWTIVEDLLYNGKYMITIDSVSIEQIICRNIVESAYSGKIQYLYNSKVFWDSFWNI